MGSGSGAEVRSSLGLGGDLQEDFLFLYLPYFCLIFFTMMVNNKCEGFFVFLF